MCQPRPTTDHMTSELSTSHRFAEHFQAISPEVRLVHCAIGLNEGAKVIWTALLSAGLRGAAVTKASLKQTGARTRAVSTRAARRVEAVASAPEQLYVSVERSRTSPQYCVGSSASQQLFRADDCHREILRSGPRGCLSSLCMLLAFPGAVLATAHPARPRPRSDTHGNPYTRVAGRSEPPNRGSA